MLEKTIGIVGNSTKNPIYQYMDFLRRIPKTELNLNFSRYGLGCDNSLNDLFREPQDVILMAGDFDNDDSIKVDSHLSLPYSMSKQIRKSRSNQNTPLIIIEDILSLLFNTEASKYGVDGVYNTFNLDERHFVGLIVNPKKNIQRYNQRLRFS